MSERCVNRVELIGRLGKDIEVKFTPDGTQVGTFNVATSKRWKTQGSSEYKESTQWHRCVLWRCESLAPYLTKGKRVFLVGELQTRSYDKDGTKHYVTEVNVRDLILLSFDEDQRQQSGPRNVPAPSAPPADQMPDGISDDDVPF